MTKLTLRSTKWSERERDVALRDKDATKAAKDLITDACTAMKANKPFKLSKPAPKKHRYFERIHQERAMCRLVCPGRRWFFQKLGRVGRLVGY